MGFPASILLTRVGYLLQDAKRIRWPEAELIDWINDGVGELVLRRPAASSKIDVLALVAGSKQQLPDGAVQLLDVIRNMGADGTAPGRAIKLAERRTLDEQDALWHQAVGTAVRHFTFDERAPLNFYIYPTVAPPWRVETLYSFQPAAIDAADDTVEVDDIYVGALANYVAYRAFSKDAEEGSLQVAVGYYTAFADSVGGQNNMTAAASPNAGR